MKRPLSSRSLRPPPALLAGAAFLLFLIWSNSFVAASYLLGAEGAPARFDWISLSIARFIPVVPICAFYCFGWRRQESLNILRQHPVRLLVCGLLGAPAYNLALYYGQQHGVPPPIASLTTALVPLFVLLLAALFLGERLTARRLLAFTVAVSGLVVISLSRGGAAGSGGYGRVVAVTALAPLSWSIYSILSKPVSGKVSPVLWTYLSIVLGGLPLLAVMRLTGGPEILALDGLGWMALLFLSLLCTVLGYAVWTWLLRHLAASTVGFTVFLNPPLTTASKWILTLIFPATFMLQVNALEWLGGGLALLGLAIAVLGAGR
jgi:drug/metabolite transporter (DMT)-like permease